MILLYCIRWWCEETIDIIVLIDKLWWCNVLYYWEMIFNDDDERSDIEWRHWLCDDVIICVTKPCWYWGEVWSDRSMKAIVEQVCDGFVINWCWVTLYSPEEPIVDVLWVLIRWWSDVIGLSYDVLCDVGGIGIVRWYIVEYYSCWQQYCYCALVMWAGSLCYICYLHQFGVLEGGDGRCFACCYWALFPVMVTQLMMVYSVLCCDSTIPSDTFCINIVVGRPCEQSIVQVEIVFWSMRKHLCAVIYYIREAASWQLCLYAV